MAEANVDTIEALSEPLTRREREVLAWLAQGLTAPEIAEKLVIAVSSVKYHIQHIYGKLGVNGRRQAVARARGLGLLSQAAGPATAAPAATGPAWPRHNLPLPLSRLIGREPELDELEKLLADTNGQAVRLVTLVGPGGVGKTRLALALAHQALADHRDGVWLVELAPLTDANLLVSTVAAALGLGDTSGGGLGPPAPRPLIDMLVDFLQAKHCLLVLDNCEHVVTASAGLAETLLKRCPRLRLLATSREPLAAAGEVVWPVLGLATPPAAAATDPPPADGYAAIELFAERARAARPGFQLTTGNAACLAQVCRQLDGLPLAIELAAARVALLPVEQIAARLDAHEGFRLLTTGGRTALPRHQTLLATIEWSYQLLTEPERRLLRRLTVFSGGWTLEAAEAVCAETPGASLLPGADVLESLGQLAAKSLVVSDHTASGEARFRLLETIREFALGKLEASGESAAIRQRHLDYFLALSERAEPETRGRHQKAWFDRLTLEHDNLRRALEWAVQRGLVEPGLRLHSALHRFWDVRGHALEANAWCKRLLGENPKPERSVAWALGLARAAASANGACDLRYAVALAKASLALSRTLGRAGQATAAHALVELSLVRLFPNPSEPEPLGPEFPPGLEPMLSESRALIETCEDTWSQAKVLERLGWFANLAGDEQASLTFEKSRNLFEQLGDLSGMAQVGVEIGHLAMEDGRYEQARDVLESALSQFRQLDAPQGIADALWMLAHALRELGHYKLAMAALDEAAELVRGLGHRVALCPNLADQAGVAYDYGRYDSAASLQDASRQVAAELGDTDWLAMLEMFRAHLARAQGDPAQAVGLIEAVLPVFRSGGHRWWMAYANEALGQAWRDLGDYERATQHLETSLAFFQPRRKWREVTGLLLHLGGVARRQGDYPRAAGLLGECLRRCQPSGPKPILAACLLECACLAADVAMTDGNLGAAEHAAGLLGAHQSLCEVISLVFPPADQAERSTYGRAVSALQDLLGQQQFAALRAEGAAMGTDDAVKDIVARLADVEPWRDPSQQPPSPD
jgi:predicted ATPase/DNA-binding CsgD family transcriptional regulator